MRFTAAHIDAFFAASGDANPLHRDAAYSRRTQFGQPVVYGMAVVLGALGHWSRGQPFQLRSLSVKFRKPLFADEPYELEVKSTARGERLRIGKGPIDYVVISLTADTWSPDPASSAVLTASPPAPRALAAAQEPRLQARRVDYSVAPDTLAALQAAFGVGPANMPVRQLAALLWASYHVGMEMPGRQALFAELSMEFAAAGQDGNALTIELENASHDERFNRYTVAGTATGIGRLALTAYKRPLPVDLVLQDLARFDDPPLRGKTVFISGAARGFGAALARSCSLAGARLALNYRGDPGPVLALRAEIEQAGGAAFIFEGSVDDHDAMRAMAREIGTALGGLDLIVNNAAPPIRELQFLEQGNADVLAFCARNLAITLEAARNLLPLVREGGQFVQVSTRYLAAPTRGFAHYLAAKGAQEGLVRGLAEEFRNVRFVVARLPRILTDQTNLPFALEPPANAGTVAHDLILALCQHHGPANFRLLEMY